MLNGTATEPLASPIGTATTLDTDRDAQVVRRRLFHRFQSPSAATASPFPRPRDEHGDTRSRKYGHDGTIPEKGALLIQHEGSLQLVAKYRPLRSTMMRDTIQRVDTAIDRHKAVGKEELEALQLFNEDAANAQVVVQKQIDDLRTARSEREVLEDQKCAVSRDELAGARTEYAAERAASGLPLPLINLSTPTMPDGNEDWLGSDGMITGIAATAGEAIGTLADAAARVAEAKAAAVHGAAIALKATPEVLREGGNILTKIWGHKRMVPNDGALLQSGTVLTGHGSESTQFPSDVPFPIEAAERQAPPAEAYAHQSGYPTKSAAARIASGNPFANFLALVTCGAIFGSSIGLLLGFIDPDAMQVAASRQIEIWGVCSAFGIALFYILGCTAEGIFALISEQYHAALVATHRQEPTAVGKWLKKATIWTAVIGSMIFCLLIGIEAVVERYGIVQLAISRMSDAVMLGHATAPKADLQGVAAIMIALIASVPFMCFHAARGWTAARLDVLSEAIQAGQTHEAWTLATEKYTRSLAELLEAQRLNTEQKELTKALVTPTGEFRLSTGPIGEDEDSLRGTRASGSNGSYSLSNVGRGDVETQLPTTMGSATAVIPPALEPLVHPWPTTAPQTDPEELRNRKLENDDGVSIEQQIVLARANERLREAYIRLRERYRSRREALEPFDTQIAHLQTMIIAEQLEMPLEGKRRIEDAYAETISAVQTFDQMYQEELKVVERLMRGGVLVRLKNWLFQPAV